MNEKFRSKKMETDRIYETIGDFDLRFGKFYDPNVKFNGEKIEIRILCADNEMQEALFDKIKEWLKT